MEGTLTLFYSRVKTMIDAGASNSFIVQHIVQELELKPQALDVALNAVSPLGITADLGRVCKDFPLNVENQDLPTNLSILAMKEFVAILEID